MFNNVNQKVGKIFNLIFIFFKDLFLQFLIKWAELKSNLFHVFQLQMIHEGNNAILLIGTTYEEDTGLFTCRVTTTAGQVESSAKLIVKSKK